MFGRRYYDRNEDGNRRDGLLRAQANAGDHAELLRHVRPLLVDADLAVVNYETPILSNPWFDPTAPRPRNYHSTKELVFASAPESVQALKDSGVDLVSLGNNHVYDAQRPGLLQTLKVLDAAGMPRFGAGRTPDEAWAPALITRKGKTFAFLGCTTVTGTDQAVPYVANETQGGAARCTKERLGREVLAARQKADTVVVMIHGGQEYKAHQTDLVRGLSATAISAGSAIVVNSHPHVVGGITTAGGGLLADGAASGTIRQDKSADTRVRAIGGPIITRLVGGEGGQGRAGADRRSGRRGLALVDRLVRRHGRGPDDRRGAPMGSVRQRARQRSCRMLRGGGCRARP